MAVAKMKVAIIKSPEIEL